MGCQRTCGNNSLGEVLLLLCGARCGYELIADEGCYCGRGWSRWATDEYVCGAPECTDAGANGCGLGLVSVDAPRMVAERALSGRCAGAKIGGIGVY